MDLVRLEEVSLGSLLEVVLFMVLLMQEEVFLPFLKAASTLFQKGMRLEVEFLMKQV